MSEEIARINLDSSVLGTRYSVLGTRYSVLNYVYRLNNRVNHPIVLVSSFLKKCRISAFVQTAVGGVVQAPSLQARIEGRYAEIPAFLYVRLVGD
jgi:hypothetical protein